ncbi:hypothetical protein GQ53DRAFT_869950 [Thozetella sp. PMI_491]|nr:hypothetical protein GQ53DRAFT_869950 [Thozetella sp. PMI_491]
MSTFDIIQKRGSSDCHEPYRWYTCNYGGKYYTGCCSVDPCGLSPGCPAANQQPSDNYQSASTTPTKMTSTVTATETAATSTVGSDTGATTSLAQPGASDGQPTQDSRLSVSVGALVAIVVGSLCFAAFLVCLYVLWSKNQRRKGKKRLLETSTSPARGVLESQGFFGGGAVSPPRTSKPPLALDDGGGPAPNARAKAKNWPIRGDAPAAAISTASERLETVKEPFNGPRATLNPTQHERDSGTYANSWTQFHNVQV